MRLRVWQLVLVLAASGCGSGGDPEEDGEDAVDETVDPGDTISDLPDVEIVTDCTVDADCEDSDPCTADTCDLDEWICDHSPTDADEDGYAAAQVDGTICDGSDCDDGDDSIHPDAAVGCEDGDDRDCDGLADRDEDSDGFVTDECAGGDDCDDSDPDAFPGSTAVDCSDLDHDCNGNVDSDNDGDGQDRQECLGSDCDDDDATVYRFATEVDCDGVDTNCDGILSLVEDADGDGHPSEACAPSGVDPDCDDEDRYVYPGAPEVCDAVDNDCDGSWADGGADDDGDTVLDETCGGTDCDDADPDSFPGSTLVDCSTTDHDCNGNPDADNDGDGHDRIACSGDDCDDTDDTYHPGSTYVDCTSLDHDCNALEDHDNDGDGHDRIACGGDDCDDSRADRYPGLRETCGDGVDQDCDTVADNSGTYTADLRVTSETHASIYPSLVWSGSEYAVSWQDDRRTTSNFDIFLARISSAGAKVGSDVDVASSISRSYEPSLAW